MLAKTLCVVFLATVSVSLAKEEELINTVLSAGTNIIKESAKVVSSEPDKYSVDLNSLYKKFEVEEKANQARSFLLTQFKRGIELSNGYIKQFDTKAEEEFKKFIDAHKGEDPVMTEKLNKVYEKTVEYDRIWEDLIKYASDADKINGYYDKSKASLKPFEQKLAEIVKKFESGALEVIKKGKKV